MKEIIAKILEDPILTARYKAMKKDDLAGFVKLAWDAGFEVTQEEVALEFKRADGELSDDTLSQVAGGHNVARCLSMSEVFHEVE